MFPHDLLLGVTLEALRTCVPVGDPPLRVEHVDRIVRDALAKDGEALFAEPKCLPSSLLLRDVACDLCEANKLAGWIADRVNDDVRPHQRPVFANPPAFVLKTTVALRCLQRKCG